MSEKSPNPFSRIPAVDKVLIALEKDSSLPDLPQPLITDLVRQEVELMREGVKAGRIDIGKFEDTLTSIREKIGALYRSRIHPVINGTGVCLHTNLGRSPLSKTAVDAIAGVGRSYNNLELDLESGERGKRGGFLEICLAKLCDAEAATVTNNCAAALILILKYFVKGERNEVIISRGELVEIGGGFRVPEIMNASGAKLVEVGATNKTTIEDYARAITPRTGMLLKVHRSNFFMEGFTGEASTEDLVMLAREHGLSVVEDLGSGAMIPTELLAPMAHEPTASEVLKRGVDLVCVSGDKLFGGPQAGIIAGRADLIDGIKKEPFFRALRCDKLILTGMQETVLEYLRCGFGTHPDLPLVVMLSATVEGHLRPRGEAILSQFANHKSFDASLIDSVARCGGGTMPKSEIPSLAIDLKHRNFSVTKMAQLLRVRSLPVMGYIADDSYRIDLRTVFPEQDGILVENILAIA